MSKVLVAGGAGFIGSHLCDALIKAGHAVICVDNLLTGATANIEHLKGNQQFEFINHDVIKPISYPGKIDCIFHLASPASPNHHSKISYHQLPLETMLVNTTGTLELLKLAEKNAARFLFASTSEVYGDPLVHPQAESYLGNTSCNGPRSVYDEAKRFGETLTSYFYRSKKLDTRIIRIFNTYGPRMAKSDMRMIANFILQALANAPLTVYGDGKQTRSLCYVSDTVSGLMEFMFRPDLAGKIINVGSEEEHTVSEYAQLVIKLTGSKSEIKLSEGLPKDDPKMRRADITLARELLSWEPKISLEEGLRKIIESYQVYKV